MFRTWLRRYLRLEGQEQPQDRTESRRLAELEESVQYLTHALRKLRGRVTGGLRADPDPAGSDGEPVSGAPPVQLPYSRQWELAQLERTRLQEYGRSVKGGG